MAIHTICDTRVTGTAELDSILAHIEAFAVNNDGLEQVGGGTTTTLPNNISSDTTNTTTTQTNNNNNNNAPAPGVQRRERQHPPRIDAHRFSRANLEESGDLELDAILGELCALENQFDAELSSKSSGISTSSSSSCSNTSSTVTTTITSATTTPSITNIINSGTGVNKMQPQQVSQPQPPRQHIRNNSGGMKQKFDMDSENTNNITRTDSPDNDSAFSDNVSMLSSESSASSGASGSGPTRNDGRHLSQTEQAAKIKAEKIKMALEKIKEANVKKLFIKAFTLDDSSKSLLVDEKMTVAHVTRLLADKNHVEMDPKWAIVEHIPDLYMERIYEDDEMLVENLLQWTRESKNKILFLDRQDKYDLFLRPERYLLSGTNHKNADYDDESRNTLIEEFFSSSSIPEVEGPLFLKSEGKKAWKKFYFVLRASGLYYCPKGKSSKSSKDLVCLVTLEVNQVYQGVGWRKKYKAPTDWGFAIKLPQLHAKSSKYIKYLCAEDSQALQQWIMGIRIAKSGRRLLENYKSLVEDLAQEDIDNLASSRSFSVASMASGSRGASQATTPSSESRSLDSCLAPSLTPSYLDGEDGDDTNSSAGSSSQDTPVNTLGRTPVWRQDSMKSASSSSSSGCLSERSSTGTPTGEHGFESEFPQGTIKRKPSSNPKLPLTTTTRLLVKEVDLEDTVDSASRTSTLRQSIRRSLNEEVSTLRRRNSASQSRSSVSSNVSSNISSLSTSLPSEPVEEEADLPLPPPPMELNDSCNPELLPPPPPEMLASTLSLNSLPPPPDEDTLVIHNLNDNIMNASITSLPPPPPPTTAKPASPLTEQLPSPPPTSPKPRSLIYPATSPPAVAPKPRRDSNEGNVVPPIYSTDIYSQNNGWHHEPPLPPPPAPTKSIYAQPQKSPQKKVKKITFQDSVEDIPPMPLSPSKPLPPKRSDSTRLSTSPGRLNGPGCKYTPPKFFLNNLQRVMQKKWQVAQKCKDFDKMPHEVLGFRDPVLPSETKRNVGAWIQEHYGSLYENLSPNGSPVPNESVQTLGQPQQPNNNVDNLSNRMSQTVPGRKRPPPLPPKRSDTTHLSIKH